MNDYLLNRLPTWWRRKKTPCPAPKDSERGGVCAPPPPGHRVLTLQSVKSSDGPLERAFLSQLASMFGLRAFVETGTYLGDTSAIASGIFAEVHTIELSAQLATQARARFAAEPRVHVHQGDSAELLPRILSQLSVPALFWLDGHYSEGVTAQGRDGNTPILAEIAAIARSGRKDAVLLIDDLRLFERHARRADEPVSLQGYPTVNELCAAVQAINSDYQFFVLGDVALAFPNTTDVTVSPLMTAMTISRLYDGKNRPETDVIAAEYCIAQATGQEREVLCQLPAAFADTENYGLGLHYRLWNAEILLGEKQFTESRRQFLEVVRRGSEQWRIRLFLGVANQITGDTRLAGEILDELTRTIPGFASAEELRQALTLAPLAPLPRPKLAAGPDALTQLTAADLHRPGQTLRLHLGCGEQHLDGYVNIDYPPTEHNVMCVKADVFANITQLDFPPGSVDEIRLHHVFEHFSRVTALAMLIRWQSWLKVGGTLWIETPDVLGSARTLVSNASLKVKMGVIRHMAGDQAASWAYHVDHWWPERYQHTLTALGFEVPEIRRTSWPQEPFLANVEAIARKRAEIPVESQLAAADRLLWESTVAPVEKPTWEVWCQQLRAVLSNRETIGPANTTPVASATSAPALPAAALSIQPSASAEMPPIYSATRPPLSSAAAAIERLRKSKGAVPLAEIHDFNQRARDRWVREKAAQIPPGARVLDVGAGTCPYHALFAHCDYRTHDFKKYDGVKLGNTTAYGKIDYVSEITCIPVPDASFDIVLCTEVLEHVPNPIEALREMTRLLRPGGQLLITAPLGSGLHQLPFHFYGGYTPAWYRHFGKEFGLDIVEITPNGGFFRLLAQECARVAWTWDRHGHLHGKDGEIIRQLFNEWLPRYLFALEDRCFVDQFTVGYHVAALKRAAASDSTDPCIVGVEGTAAARAATIAIVFSKDRPLQLDATLRSFAIHCRDSDRVPVSVLYTTSSSEQQALYHRLQAEHPTVAFVHENSFKADLLRLLDSAQYVLFLVDDSIFVRGFAIGEVIAELDRHPAALGFSLRLGRNTTYCYPHARSQKTPPFRPVGAAMFTYDWPTAELDFGYPLEVSSSVYRLADLFPLLRSLAYTNPNTLEALLAAQAIGFATSHPALLCYSESIAFSAPINRVQDTCINRAGAKQDYSAATLAQMFAQGRRLDMLAHSGFTPNACHQEVEIKLTEGEPMRPTVSIIIPCYQQAHFLREAVGSVIAQTFIDWEIIIVNDGSPDDTATVVRQIIADQPDRRIHLHEQANQGLAMARNNGIRAARGRFILPLDADDLLAPEFLARTVPILETTPSVAIVYTDYVRFGANNGLELVGEWTVDHLRENNQLAYCSLYRREVWEAVGGYNPNMTWGYEDWDFWLGAAERGLLAWRVHEPLLHYRVKSGSMYTKAMEHDAELRARMVLNHPRCYPTVRQLAARQLLARIGPVKPPATPSDFAHLEQVVKSALALGKKPAAERDGSPNSQTTMKPSFETQRGDPELDELLRRARGKVDVQARIPRWLYKLLPRFLRPVFRNQGGYNLLVLETLERTAQGFDDTAKHWVEMDACIDVLATALDESNRAMALLLEETKRLRTELADMKTEDHSSLHPVKRTTLPPGNSAG